ncbi:hypothetical protein HUJ04_006232 [Dendroctonus ponderosae]|nr:hypothetical protein HUJ04_006232 [Dendroctonus ponderosae]KAH1012296.1 hypothetical protein HUJ05_011477 [Dendroctonus ponderosae]
MMHQPAVKSEADMPMIVVQGPSRENLQEIPYVDEGAGLNTAGESALAEEPAKRSNCVMPRKNSISLPNLDELKIVNEVQQVSSCNSQSDIETDDEIGDGR